MFNQTKKITLDDIYNMIEEVGQVRSSDDNIHTFNNNPIHLLIHESISQFDVQELQAYEKRHNTLLDICYLKYSYLAYASLLHKGAFLDQLNTNQKWFLENIKPLNLDVYANIFSLKQTYINSTANSSRNIIYCFSNAIKNLSDAEKKINTEKFVSAYHIDFLNEFVRDFAEVFTPSLIKLGFDINKNFPLNRFLPETTYNTDKKSKFFISSLDNQKIKSLLEMGYRFDEENYRYQGETLMTSLLDSGRIDLIEIIMPYLHHFDLEADKEKHYTLIEAYKGKKIYEDLKRNYNYLILNKTLHNNNTYKAKLKL